LTISLEGGLEEFEEFFLSRAFSASNAAIRANNGAIAAAINPWTSLSLWRRLILPVVTTSRKKRKSQARIIWGKL